MVACRDELTGAPNALRFIARAAGQAQQQQLYGTDALSACQVRAPGQGGREAAGQSCTAAPMFVGGGVGCENNLQLDAECAGSTPEMVEGLAPFPLKASCKQGGWLRTMHLLHTLGATPPRWVLRI